MWEVNIIKNEIEVSFSGENFDDYVSIMKSNGLIFNNKKKVWTTSSPKLFKEKVLPILQSIEPGKVNINKLNKLAEEEEVDLDQTYFFRNKLDSDSIKLPPIKGKPPYENFQIDCIKKGICQNRYGLFLQMGTGKTFIVVSILNQLFKQNKIDKVLVVCPGEALYNWRRELKRFSTFAENNESILISTANKNRDPLQDLEKPVYIMTYRHFLTLSDDYYQKKNNRKSTKYIKPTIPWNEWGTNRVIVLDESHCFSYNTFIQTEIGPIPIGEIVEKKLDIKILTYNFEKKINEYKKIKNYFTHNVKKTTTNIVQDIYGNYITKDHVYYTNNGFKKIGDFNEEESLFMLRKLFSTKCRESIVLFRQLFKGVWEKRGSKSSKIWVQRMRMVWGTNDSNSKKSILFKKLFSQMENETTRSKRKSIHSKKCRKAKRNEKKEIQKWGIQRFSGKNLQKNEGKQPDVCSRIQGENEEYFNRDGAYFQRMGKRKNNRTSTSFVQTVKRIISKFIYCLRICHSYQKNRKTYTNKLQGRYRNSQFKNKYRSRRKRSLFQKRQGKRYQKRKSIKEIKLEGNKDKKRGYFRELPKTNTGEDITLYNLEMEDNKNYFANNFLVHNCIKSSQSRQSKVLHLHKKYFEYRYLLTGTPTPNEFGEIYSQIRFLDEKVIPEKSYYHWIGKVAHIGNRFSAYAVNKEKGDNGYKSEEVEEEQKKISPLVTRYKSNEVLELPDLMIKPYYTELTDIQKEIYQHIVNYVIYKVKEENEGRLIPKKVFNQFAFIVQAYENACLLKGKVDPVYSSKLNKLIEKFKFDNKHHAKLSIVDSLLEEYLNEQKKKVAIMDYHPLTIEQLVERYKKYNPVFIHGGSTPKEKNKDEHRDEVIEKFKHDKDCNLLVGSSMVLSTAINLTECTRVIYFSRNFSYLDWSQSIKRFHRIGSTEPVIVNPVISENTLEERVETALQNKKDLDDTIFNKDYLTQEDWKKIFTGNSL